MIGQHASHRESGEKHLIAVDVIARHHLVDEREDEVDVATPADVPCLVDTVGKYDDKLGGVGHGLYFKHALLVSSILIHAVTADEQRPFLAKVGRNILQIVARHAVYGQCFLCRCRQRSPQQQSQCH